MEQLDQIASMLALTMGAAWASGINLYAAILTLGLLSLSGNIQLPPDLQILADPLVVIAAAAMYLVEFFVDKTPGLDTGWDILHTFIRIPAGALLAAGAVGDVTPAVSLAAAIFGGGLAAAAHTTKAGSRALINTSPEPFSNWAASIGEDVAVIGGLWTALHHPYLFLALLLAFILLLVWLLPRIWRGIMMIVRKATSIFGGRKPPESPPQATDTAGTDH